jgi:hypothetical protein
VAIARFHEATIVDLKSDLRLHLLVVPRASLFNPSILDKGGDLVSEKLDLIITFESRSPASLQAMLAAMLVGKGADNANELHTKLRDHPPDSHWELIGQDTANFVEQVVHSRFVFFENPHSDSLSLAEIVSSTGSDGTDFTVGFAAFVGEPLLLITVPQGLLLCGADPCERGKLEEIRAVLTDRVICLVKDEIYKGTPQARRPIDKLRATVVPGKLNPRKKTD